jgi:hypothetical protein
MMTPADRRAEVAAILATAFLRLRLREAKQREKSLDVIRRPSDECLESTSRRREPTCPPQTALSVTAT